MIYNGRIRTVFHTHFYRTNSFVQRRGMNGQRKGDNMMFDLRPMTLWLHRRRRRRSIHVELD